MSELPLPEQFRGFADGAEADGATTYAAICRGVADDPALLALLALAPAAQRRPNILLAAVHFLLLSGARHPLATHYDTVPRRDTSPAPAPGDVVADFHSFCLEHHDELLELITRRSTQTNEVGRCAALLPALSCVAALYRPGQRLSLLDLGASAGLNLLFERYCYIYRQRSDGSTSWAGDTTSAVIVDCTVRGELRGLPPLRPPPVAARVGLDLHPIDPSSEEDARWLLACLWPDNLSRFTRLREALAVARTTAQPPVLHRGDIVDDLERVAGTISTDSPLVIFHTWAAAYLTTQRQGDLVEAVRAIGASRPVHYLYAEQLDETRDFPHLPRRNRARARTSARHWSTWT